MRLNLSQIPAIGSGSGAVSPMDYGAVGNGSADDKAAVEACFAAALAGGLPVDGGEYLYGVSGSVTVTSATRPWVQRLRLKQLNPSTSCKTLHFDTCDQVRVDSLFVHAGDSPGVGAMNTAAGFQITGGSRHIIRRVEVTGSGMITGAKLYRCLDSLFDAIHVHDIDYAAVYNTSTGTGDVGGNSTNGYFGVADDRLIGISFMECVNCELRSPVVRNLNGNAQGYTQSSRGSTPRTVKSFKNHQTRGIVASGDTDCTITNPKVDMVGQGIDVTGSQGHINLQIIGGHIKHCVTGGVNIKSNSRRVRVLGTIVENAGTYCFWVGGGNYLGASSDNRFSACTAINPGYNDFDNDLDGEGGVPITNASAGFVVYRNDTGGGAPAPSGIAFVDCAAVDDQGFYFADITGGFPTSRADDDPTIVPSGTTSLEMTAPWTGYDCTIAGAVFANGQTRTVTLTYGSTTVTFPALTSAITNSGGDRSNFVKLPTKMRYGFLGEGPSVNGNTVGRGSTSKGHAVAAILNLTDNR